jgi:hypothetical protein
VLHTVVYTLSCPLNCRDEWILGFVLSHLKHERIFGVVNLLLLTFIGRLGINNDDVDIDASFLFKHEA